MSHKIEDFRDYNGWTNWATWNVNSWIDELQITELARGQSSAKYLQELCEHFIRDFSDFWEEDRFETKYFNDKEWDNVNWKELFETYKEEL